MIFERSILCIPNVPHVLSTLYYTPYIAYHILSTMYYLQNIIFYLLRDGMVINPGNGLS